VNREMSMVKWDLIVIGGGSAGVRCSRRAAEFGARVLLCESKALGGTCVNVGCVPKKLFAYGAQFSDHIEDARGFGWQTVRPELNWSTLIQNKDAEISRLNGIYERMLQRAGVEIVRGHARVSGEGEVTVGKRVFRGQNLVIATGGQPFVPALEGGEHLVTSDEIFSVAKRPERTVVLGGGYIGVEFASILNGFGSQVTLVHRGDMFLRAFDDDCRRVVAAEMQKRGVDLQFGRSLRAVRREEDGRFSVELADGEILSADLVMGALGRRPNTAGLDLEARGVVLSPRGGVEVDDRFQTSVSGIYAIGDVIERVALTPVALAEGEVLARRLFGPGALDVDYTDIPTAVFSNPTLSTVGLTEAEARQKYDAIRVYKANFRPMLHTMSGRDARVFMKLLVDDGSDRVVGCHMVGPEAAELVQGLAIAMRAGATKAHFDATIGIHPTAAEEFVTMRTPVVD
jgi:glutathione reductase (NADPH)